MEWNSGNIFIRATLNAAGGNLIGEHEHNFDHTHFVRAGWVLIRGRWNGQEVILQKAAEEYHRTRSLLMKYEPESVRRPIRWPDKVDPETGKKSFVLTFVGQGEAVPYGGEEIIFAPTGYHVLIKAGVKHEMAMLADGGGDCVYAHHTAQGDIVQINDGYAESYR